MAEAKDIDDSLEFLRYFEKNSVSQDLADIVLQKRDSAKQSLDLKGHRLKNEEFEALSQIEPLHRLKRLDLGETSLSTSGLKTLCLSPLFAQAGIHFS